MGGSNFPPFSLTFPTSLSEIGCSICFHTRHFSLLLWLLCLFSYPTLLLDCNLTFKTEMTHFKTSEVLNPQRLNSVDTDFCVWLFSWPRAQLWFLPTDLLFQAPVSYFFLLHIFHGCWTSFACCSLDHLVIFSPTAFFFLFNSLRINTQYHFFAGTSCNSYAHYQSTVWIPDIPGARNDCPLHCSILDHLLNQICWLRI